MPNKGKTLPLTEKLKSNAEQIENGMNTDPADKWHGKLKYTKNSRNTQLFFLFHFGLIKTIGHGNRESIHSQSNTKQYAVYKKHEIHFHRLNYTINT